MLQLGGVGITPMMSMSLDRMPIFGWYILATAAMMVVAFPPLILASILLEVERAFGLPFFDPTRGGDALLWQHLFWLFGHPDVYIIFLPMAAVLSTILPVFAGRPLIGYRAIVVAIVALAFMSFGIWVHHMVGAGGLKATRKPGPKLRKLLPEMPAETLAAEARRNLEILMMHGNRRAGRAGRDTAVPLAGRPSPHKTGGGSRQTKRSPA